MKNTTLFLVIIPFFINLSINGQVFYTDPPLEDSNISYIDQFKSDIIDCSLTLKEFNEVLMDWARSDLLLSNINSLPICISGSDLVILDPSASSDDMACQVEHDIKVGYNTIEYRISIEFRKGRYRFRFRDFKKNGTRDNYYTFLSQKEFQDVLLADLDSDNGMSNRVKDDLRKRLADAEKSKQLRVSLNRITLARRNKVMEVLNTQVKKFSEKVSLKER